MQSIIHHHFGEPVEVLEAADSRNLNRKRVKCVLK